LGGRLGCPVQPSLKYPLYCIRLGIFTVFVAGIIKKEKRKKKRKGGREEKEGKEEERGGEGGEDWVI